MLRHVSIHAIDRLYFCFVDSFEKITLDVYFRERCWFILLIDEYDKDEKKIRQY